MSQDFSKFDNFKRDLGDKWHSVSVYDIEGLEVLLLDGLKLYFYSLMNKKRDIPAYIDGLFKKAKRFYQMYKITEGFKGTEEKLNGTLRKFIEGQF